MLARYLNSFQAVSRVASVSSRSGVSLLANNARFGNALLSVHLNNMPLMIAQAEGFASAKEEKEKVKARLEKEKEKEKALKQREREKEREAKLKVQEKARELREKEKAQKEKEKEKALKLKEKERSQKEKAKQKEVEEKLKEKKRKQKELDAMKPKRSRSAYLFFVQDQLPVLKSQNPTTSILELVKQMGAKWNALTEDQKKVYEEKAAADKIRAQSDREAYKKTLPPKRPPSAFVLFANSLRGQIAAENPKAPITEVTKIIGTKWAALGDGEKQKFKEEANKLKEAYEKKRSQQDSE